MDWVATRLGSRGLSRIVSRASGPVLLGALIACSTPPQAGPRDGSENVNQLEQCSTLGVMACKAMALVSRDSIATCRTSRVRDGSRIEICGHVQTDAKSPGPARADSNVYPVHLAWSDNSDNESNFVIERCDEVRIAPNGVKKTASCAGVWRPIATVRGNTTSYIDNTTTADRSYLYRVKAINSKGSSGYTQEAVITTPSR